MRLGILFFLTLVFSYAFSQEQVINGNMENWTGSQLNDWNNSINIVTTIYTAEQTTDAYQGNYAAKLESKNYVVQVVPGMLMLGNLDLQTFTPSGGTGFTSRPTGMTVFFKYDYNEPDTMAIIAYMTKWNTTQQKTDTIAATFYFTGDKYLEYTKLSVPFLYLNDQNPDTINILMFSSGFNAKAGSTLIVDSLTMEYGDIIAPTMAFPATGVTATQFTANWLNIPNTDGYFLDVAIDPDFTYFIPGFENKDVGLTDNFLVNISPGSYYYRLRTAYGTETSINSNSISVYTPTIFYEALNITHNSADLNWETAVFAENYRLDVATDNTFTNFVQPYQDFTTGNVINLNITGLQELTTYYARLRTEYMNGIISDNSNVIQFTTGEFISANDITQEKIFIYSNNKKIIIQNSYNKLIQADIYDLSGKKIYSNKTNETLVVNVKTTGLYLINLKTGKDNSKSTKVFVQ